MTITKNEKDVLLYFLKAGYSTRQLDKAKLGLNPKKSKGYSSWTIRNKYNLRNEDKHKLFIYGHKQALSILEQDRFTALGIAAGYVNLVSSQLGYGTGCCTCILDKPRLRVILELEKNPLLVMGIGFKQEGKNRRVHHLRDNTVFTTRKKQPIEINYVY